MSSRETRCARPRGEELFAAIDVGSHTIRLIIAACHNREVLQPCCVERRVTRLARGFAERAWLDPESINASIAVLREYSRLIGEHGASSLVCGATGVMRKARNSAAFLAQIAEQTAIAGVILSAEREATLSVTGVLSALPGRTRPFLSFDLGGSSTEFTLVDPAQPEPLWSTSVFLGAATATAGVLSADPPPLEAVEQSAAAIRRTLQPALAELAHHLQRLGMSPEQIEVVGTAGTVTTLAAMRLRLIHYQPYRINGLRLETGWVAAVVDQLARLPLARRRELPGLEAGREDIILGGALMVREILRGLNRETLLVTDAGLLEGLLLSGIQSAFGWPPALTIPLRWHWQPE